MSLILDIRYIVFDLSLVALVYSTPVSRNTVVLKPYTYGDSGRMVIASTGDAKDLDVYLSKQTTIQDQCSRCTVPSVRISETVRGARLVANIGNIDSSLEETSGDVIRILVRGLREKCWHDSEYMMKDGQREQTRWQVTQE